MTFTPEQMNKAKAAKSAEELLALAKESGIELTEDEAKKYFAELNKQGELNDDELTSVAGGSKGTPDPLFKKGDQVTWKKNPICVGTIQEVTYYSETYGWHYWISWGDSPLTDFDDSHQSENSEDSLKLYEG